MNDLWADAPIVEVPLVVVRCPCGSADYVTIRSMGNQGDGSRLRRCLSLQTTDSFDVFVHGSPASERGEAVATSIDGQFLLYQPHDEDGNSLPFPEWPGADVETN